MNRYHYHGRFSHAACCWAHLRHQFLDVPTVFRYGFVVEQNPSERHPPLASCPPKSRYRQSAFRPSSTTLPAGRHDLPRHSLEGYGRFGCPLGPSSIVQGTSEALSRLSPSASCPPKSRYKQNTFCPSSKTLPAGCHDLPQHSLEGYGRFGRC